MQVTAMSGFALSAPDSPDCTPTNSSILILSSQESSQESDTSSSDPSVIAVWSQESTQPEPLSATLTSGFAAHATDLASAAVKSPQPVYTARSPRPAACSAGSSRPRLRRDLRAAVQAEPLNAAVHVEPLNFNDVVVATFSSIFCEPHTTCHNEKRIPRETSWQGEEGERATTTTTSKINC
ncbi:hypothetical protein PR002_g2198 [Phytophthora rubi]|uniref:Uncharacterized protein n=1 Tax=Phytophthora rubi TaxID=129364 RepID=A0A6A3NVF0_9STRA|nr:hypothetical protein PR002_g2198 [Phytophthora rubi]